MKLHRIIGSGLLFAGVLSMPARADWQEIKGEELRKVLVTNVFSGTKADRGAQVQFNLWYSADGTATIGTSNNDGDKGRWDVRGDGFCRDFGRFTPMNGCMRMWIDGNSWKTEPLPGERVPAQTGSLTRL